MFQKLGFASFSLFLFSFFLSSSSTAAQSESGRHARVLVTQHIDDEKLVTLHGNTRPEAKPENDRGPVHGNFPMEHMLLQLRRSPEQELALQQFLDELHTQGSPNFHQWISAEEFGEKYGVAKQDLDAVTDWLESKGFRVNVVYQSGIVIDFSGTAAQVRKAFRTDIRHFEHDGRHHIGNNSDPRIPAALAPIIVGIVSLHSFQPHAMHQMHQNRPNFTFPDPFGGTALAVVPADLATIYNLNPLFSAGFTGRNQTIVLIEDTNLFTNSDWNKFRSTFGLSGYTFGSLTTVHPAPSSGSNNCANPGVVSPNDAEAILDAEWASAAAPNAAIRMASCADTTTTFGGLIALQNLINASSQPPAIMSISYGQCETVNGAAANQAYYSAYQQAVAEGVSVFVASGDSGAAGCDNSVSQATHGIGVNAFASTPYNVAVGGTDFSDTYAGTNSLYWNSTNSSAFGSARSYIPEIPWNDSCAGSLISSFEGYPPYGPDSLCNSPLGGFLATTVAGGGGPSGCATGTPSPTNSGIVSGTCQGWPKPSWQSIVGNPSDGVRDTPDISLFAADGLWSHYYVFCWSHASQGGAACTGNPSGWSGAGGTSFSAPIMAGIQALVNQKVNARQGNPNPAYYQLAAAEYGSNAASSCNSSNGNTVPGSCIFYDVTLGDMDVNCAGSANCYLAGGSVGVLSTSNSSFSPAYPATTGWDFATGIGTLNAANLVNNWPGSSTQPALSVTKTHAGSFTQGQQNAVYSVTISNAFNATPSTGTVTVSETVPSGLSLVSMAGTGWTCSAASCSRNDVLSAGASFPAITVTVNVASNATSPQINQVSVSGGGSASATATDSTTIAIPILPAVANFVTADTSTQGSWHGVYGADGYSIANDSQSIPSYATFAMQNQFSYTWASTTTDPRALQTGTGSGRIASTWYNSGTFTFDVNFTDGNLHRLALYALDWDANGRTETVQVLDANTNAVLDTRTLSSFSNGTYLVWSISGHVKVNVIWTGGVNAVVSGVFFGGTSGGGPETVSVTPQNVSLSAGQQQQFAATVTGTPNQAVTWSIASVNPSSAAPGSISAAGLYTAPAVTTTAQVTIKATSADGTASGTSKINLVVKPVANFVTADTSTQGSWHGVYGADGYSIANDSQSIPSYATFAMQNQFSYTWASTTTDPRALQTGAGSGRIASTWWNSGTFTFDVNFTDGNLHRFALYALDWDANGRTETVQVLDANTNAVLDTRTLSSFSNGTYLVWSISGHVKVNVIWTGGVNAVVSGVFFGGTSGGSPETVSVTPQNVTLSAGQQQQFAATVTGTPNQAVTWSIASINPSSAASGSISAAGLYTAPAVTTTAQVTIKATSADGTASGTSIVNLTTSSAANFVNADTSTQGSWHGVYGADGYSVANDSQSIPSYATLAMQNQFSYTWASSTTDPRALQTGTGSGRIASTWYLSGTFTFDVNLTDGNPHQFALYALDWDAVGRTETIQIVDANTNAVLDTRTLTGFNNGVYLVWNLSGHVKVNVIWTGGVNAVVSGVFFK